MRIKNDQDFSKFGDLIIEALEEYEKKDLNIKLWNRQWRAIEMYFNGSSYKEVLETLFGARSSSNIINHKTNKHFNTKIF